MANHTPGPWLVISGSPPCVRGTEGANVANDVPFLEDARLIAAAPDLLAALDSIEDAASVGRSTFGTLPDSAEDRCIYCVNRLIEIAAKCRAATNKARGI